MRMCRSLTPSSPSRHPSIVRMMACFPTASTRFSWASRMWPPSVLEELHRPMVIKARSPRKITNSPRTPFSPVSKRPQPHFGFSPSPLVTSSSGGSGRTNGGVVPSSPDEQMDTTSGPPLAPHGGQRTSSTVAGHPDAEQGAASTSTQAIMQLPYCDWLLLASKSSPNSLTCQALWGACCHSGGSLREQKNLRKRQKLDSSVSADPDVIGHVQPLPSTMRQTKAAVLGKRTRRQQSFLVVLCLSSRAVTWQTLSQV
ncbi:hypothetical protein MTO96_017392 [Rhipicephalus appendiculatus]